MPELPEVETSRRSLERAFRGKRIIRVSPDFEDRIVFDSATPKEFQKKIEGARVLGSGRKGKYFWLVLDRRPWPVFHLGMTGNVMIRKPGRAEFLKAWGGRLWCEGKEGKHSKELFFSRLLMVAEDGTEMAITDPRRFGRIRLANNPLLEAPISRLGNDPMGRFPFDTELHEILSKKRAPIKSVLLDQAVFAGVGNWIADEVLFQSRLSPHRKASSLTPTEVQKLRSKLLSILQRAVADRADYDKYPRTWLFHFRWGKEEGAMTAQREYIRFDSVGGRTSAWVPNRQK